MQLYTQFVCLFLTLKSFVFNNVVDDRDNGDYVAQGDEEGLLCRRCGHEVANAISLQRRMPSSLSLKQRNDTILGIPGVLIQLFENPAGERFEVITSEKADIYYSGAGFSQFTWFPGYTWKIALCPACGAHLGWFFESQEKSCSGQSQSHLSQSDESTCEKTQKPSDSFAGLILDNILSADFASTLTMIPKPKSFRSY